MKKLYSDTLLAGWKARAKKYLFSAAGCLLAGLLVCIMLCTRVNTGNADALLFAVIALATVTGWMAMLLLYFGYAPARAQCGHIQGILEGSTEEYTGEMHVLGEKIHIPKSVDMCKVALKCGEETKTFNVNSVLMDNLPANGAQVRVQIVRNFITAYEVTA